jgi:hypothetical protein
MLAVFDRRENQMAQIAAYMSNFLQEWAELGGNVARQHGLPVSAMLACASVESNWGQGAIFRATLNPFSLQKWPHIKYPVTHQTYWRSTVVQTEPVKRLLAPFNCATTRSDAVRQWCEWILHYGDSDGPPQDQDAKAPQVAHSGAVARRTALLASRVNPVAFARGLSTIGFGENQASGGVYAQRLISFSMTDYD